MAVDAKHPDYTPERVLEWQTMRDVWDGESAVKKAATKYLPMPDGWLLDDPITQAKRYQNYQGRARFPEITANVIRSMVGVLHGDDWNITLPASMEYIREAATLDNLPLNVYAKRVTIELLTTGRAASLADAPAGGGNPYLTLYGAERLINWEPFGGFYVLEETLHERDGFEWKAVTRHRVLTLDGGVYVQQVYDDKELVETYEPNALGGGRLDFIPLAVGGAMDMDLKPDTPPLLGVARAALAHYQINADYRYGLYMAGQATLVFYNLDPASAPKVVGSGVVIGVTSNSTEHDVRAEYLEPSGASLEAHERAQDREFTSATRSGAQLFDTTPRGQESGEARRLRFSMETASLSAIVGASAAILERSLRHVAIMLGADPNEVTVEPPKNLLDGVLEPQQIQAIVGAWQSGAISYQTMYDNLQRGRVANPDRVAEEEEALILGERDTLPDDSVV